MTEEKIPQKAGFVNVFILYCCGIRLFMITLHKAKNGIEAAVFDSGYALIV
jgi:hypothetical protein